MNTAIFWRLVWKEYRQQRALWLAIAAAGLIFQVAVLVYCVLNGVSDLPDKVFTVALSVPILYSLGCGATLFAGEHEADTFSFQQSLPVAAGRVFKAKVVFALFSALALFPVLWLLAFAMTSWKLPDANWHRQLWGGGVVATVEVLIWATLGSLVLGRVLPAAIVSGVVAVLLGYSSLVTVMLFGGLFQQQVDDYFLTLPLRSLCALIGFLVAVKFGRCWFDERPTGWSTLRPGIRAKAARSIHNVKATKLTVMQRLLWQVWRESRATIFWFAGGYFVLVLWFALGANLTNSRGPHWEASFWLLPFLATALGASVFWSDQQGQQYRFFTEHGVRPRLVWLSRQLVRSAVLVGIAAMACVTLLFEWPEERGLPGAALGLTVLMFAAGQVCSIFIRSGIVAIFSAVLCSVVLFGWTMFLIELGVWWVVSSLPLPLIFWWVTWLYAPKWIQERTTWRVRIVTAASIVVPLLGVMGATAAYRVYEIPAIVTSFDTSLVTTPVSAEAQKTAEMYAEASVLFLNKVAIDADGKYAIASRDDEWQRGIDLFITASERKESHFPSFSDPPAETLFYLEDLLNAVVAEARQLVSESKFEESERIYESLLRYVAHLYHQRSTSLYAFTGGNTESKLWEELPNWAAASNQDNKRILKMLDNVQEFGAHNSPDWRLALLEEHVLAQRTAAMDDEVLTNYYGMDRRGRILFKIVGTLMPWERWRVSRLADVLTESELMRLNQPATPLSYRQIFRSVPAEAEFTLTTRSGGRFIVGEDELLTWTRTTPFLQFAPYHLGNNYRLSFERVRAQRSAVETQLALIAWRKQHGQLPESLDELVHNPFETLPVDAYTQRPFVYFPNGIEEEIWDDDGMMGMAMGGMGSGMFGGELAPMMLRKVRTDPFIWSPGEQVRYVPDTTGDVVSSPLPNEFQDHQERTLTEQDLLHEGVRYPIPTVQQQPSGSSDDDDALPMDE
jgi:hypothetical protein